MDVAAIRSLMRKTQASILENGFLGLDDPKHVSVMSFTSFLILKCVLLKINQAEVLLGGVFTKRLRERNCPDFPSGYPADLRRQFGFGVLSKGFETLLFVERVTTCLFSA